MLLKQTLTDPRHEIYRNLSIQALMLLSQTNSIVLKEIVAYLSIPDNLLNAINLSTPKETLHFIRKFFRDSFSDTPIARQYANITININAQINSTSAAERPPVICLSILLCNNITELNEKQLALAEQYTLKKNYDRITKSIAAIKIVRDYDSDATNTTIILPTDCYLNLSGADLEKVNLSNLKLNHANFNGCNLKDANLQHNDITGAYLNNTNLTGSNLNNSIFIYASLIDSDLSRATMEMTRFDHANMTGTDMTEANLSMTGLINANLTGTKFFNGIDIRDTLALDLHLDMLLERLRTNSKLDSLRDALTSNIVSIADTLDSHKEKSSFFKILYHHPLFKKHYNDYAKVKNAANTVHHIFNHHEDLVETQSQKKLRKLYKTSLHK